MNQKATNKYLFDQSVECKNCKWFTLISNVHYSSIRPLDIERCIHPVAIKKAKFHNISDGLYCSWMREEYYDYDEEFGLCKSIGTLYESK